MYQFYLPTKLVFGNKSIESIPDQINSISALFNIKITSILLISGRSAAKSSGLLAKMQDWLKQYQVTVFDQVQPEPDIEVTDKALNLAKQTKTNLVIGLGGGSAIDVAKAVAVLANKQNVVTVKDYLEVDGTKSPESAGVPMIAIPTISGSGIESTRNSVIYNPETKCKRSFRSDYIFPTLSIIDPELTLSVPPKQTAIAGIDAFCHLIESYISKKSTPVCDVLCLQGMRLILDNLARSVNDPADLNLRTALCLASVYGGIVISNSGLTAGHGTAAIIGPRFNILHGVACAVMLTVLLDYNFQFLSKEKQAVIKNMFGDQPGTGFKQLLKQLNIEPSFSVHGVRERDLDDIVAKSLVTGSTKGNTVGLTQESLLTIMKKLV
jgi:alcohol dehydrogenase